MKEEEEEEKKRRRRRRGGGGRGDIFIPTVFSFRISS
jgi:hypothetical protein